VAGGLLGGFTIGIKENNRQDIVQALTAGIPGLTQLGRPLGTADTLASGGTNTFVGPTDDALYVDLG
jgi:hypothetical protein